MGRQPCCEKVGLKKGPWSTEEDKKLIDFLLTNGHCSWRAVPKLAGLLRCGKSCRLRWANYLRPDLKRGLLSESEEKMVIDLHAQLGNRWSKIVSHLPGRTDNEIKNHWNTHIKKKLKKMGIDPQTHKPISVPCPVVEETSSNVTEVEETPLNSSIVAEVEEVQVTTSTTIVEPQTAPDPCAPTSSTCSSSFSSSSPSNSIPLRFEDLEFPDFDWAYSSDVSSNGVDVGFWEDDFSSWDFLVGHENDEEPIFQESWA